MADAASRARALTRAAPRHLGHARRWPCCRPSAASLVPFVVQHTTDDGLLAERRPRHRRRAALRPARRSSASPLTACLAYVVNVRLFRASENGLATLRLKAFRHIHDLSMLTQNTERRGSLVSPRHLRRRHDLDVRAVRRAHAHVSLAQITVATVLMVVYSPLLGRRRLALLRAAASSSSASSRASSAAAYTLVRERVGDLLGAISESVVGAATIRAYGVEERTARAHRRRRRGAPRGRHRRAGPLGRRVHVRPARLRADDRRRPRRRHHPGGARPASPSGELLAFLFLVNLFTQPVQQATEILNEMQNAVAGLAPGHRRHRHPGRRRRPRRRRRRRCRAGRSPSTSTASASPTPAARRCCTTSTCRSRRAVAGRHRRRDRLGQVDARQAAHPADGPDRGQRAHRRGRPARRPVRLAARAGSCSCPRRASSSTRTLLDNVRFGRPEATEEDVRLTLTELGLDAWLAGLPQRPGDRRSASAASRCRRGSGSSSRWPGPTSPTPTCSSSTRPPRRSTRAPRSGIQRALDGLTRGRTSIAIAHRLSTAEAADEVIVVDARAGRRARAAHASSSTPGASTPRLHASWVAQQGSLTAGAGGAVRAAHRAGWAARTDAGAATRQMRPVPTALDPRSRGRRAAQARRATASSPPSCSSTTPARCSWSAGWTTRRCAARSPAAG